MFRQVLQQLNDQNLLTREQLLFVDDVNQVLEEEILNNPRANLRDDREVLPHVAVIQENLNVIINNLSIGRPARERYLDAFPRFKRIRDSTVTKLYDISSDTNKNRRNFNVTKLPGYGSSLFGGALTLVSLAAPPLLVPGVILTGFGCALTFGTCLTETVLLKENIKKAQEVIEEDQRAFRELGNWLDSAAKMQRALIEILNMCPYIDITNAIKDLVESASRITDRAERITIQTTVQAIIGDFVDRGTELPLMKIATIISALVIVFQLLENTQNRYVFHVALLTVIGNCALNFENIRDIASLINIINYNQQHARNMIRAIVREATSVGTAFDVANIISDVSNGSISLQKKIEKTAEELRKEADKIERVYNYIC